MNKPLLAVAALVLAAASVAFAWPAPEPSHPCEMIVFNDRIYVYQSGTLYRVEPEKMFVEQKLELTKPKPGPDDKDK